MLGKVERFARGTGQNLVAELLCEKFAKKLEAKGMQGWKTKEAAQWGYIAAMQLMMVACEDAVIGTWKSRK